MANPDEISIDYDGDGKEDVKSVPIEKVNLILCML